MACRYSIEERRKIAAWMEVFQSPRIVQERFRAWTGRDAPSRLTIGRIYEKFVRTGSVQDDCKGNSGRKRSVRTEENIINVQGAMVASPTKSTRRLARETKISRRSLIRILHYDLGMKPYHLQNASFHLLPQEWGIRHLWKQASHHHAPPIHLLAADGPLLQRLYYSRFHSRCVGSWSKQTKLLVKSAVHTMLYTKTKRGKSTFLMH
ncbi:hypothetical protein C0J52_16036 [Blattella germanica]|nr:hypothetical protein C0J52_16036 [Blattella germanica]